MPQGLFESSLLKEMLIYDFVLFERKLRMSKIFKH